ncbi:MAG: MerR family transcriptional regulator [Candidatus Dormibacteraeota bacterium]|nr:MerR family transcriptional regulator [Candidatus Dormibacteraeota bacterium]
MEYRIEQLAQSAGVAVDTIRFYQGKGLLEAPRREGRVTWYADAHLERLRRIRQLQQRGFTLTVIRRFLEGELETSDEALVEAVTAPHPPQSLSLDELAAASGIAVPLLHNLEQAGLLTPTEDGEDARYPAEDLAALEAGMKVVEAGVPLSALLELGAEHAAAADRTARKAVELFDRHVRERLQAEGRPGAEVEADLVREFEELLEASGTLVRHHFRRALVRAAREHIERRV